MVNAFRAGTIVAIVAAGIGWFMVLRRETFAGHTLSVVGFPGGAGAIWLGLAAVWGYFAFCIAAALVIAAIPSGRARGYHEESAAIGTLQAFALACGFLFVSLYGGFANGFNALLFGSFLGVTDAQVVTLLVVGVGALLVVGAIARPLLFASVDPDVAAARGVPVRLLSVVFLVVLGVAVAEASQITGSLLVFALLVVPAATAQVVTARPVLGLLVVDRRRPRDHVARPRDRLLLRRTRSGSGSRRSRSASSSPKLARASSERRGDRRRRPARCWRPEAGCSRCSRTRSCATRSSPAPRSRRRRGSSATSSCCAARSSAATRSATRRSPARSVRSRSASTCGSGCSSSPPRSRSAWACSARAVAPTTS